MVVVRMEFKNKKMSTSHITERSVKTSFLAGAVAGLVVDVALFPLDTLKTRLQSQYGFWKSGGFRGIYKGILPTAVGSAPCAAVFFAAYNAFKISCKPYIDKKQEFIVQMAAAAIGETISCVVKVPTEIIKQRRQACVSSGNVRTIILKTFRNDGPLGFYRGFWTTVLRDAPFSIMQYPLWEYFKEQYSKKKRSEPTPVEGALCGAVAGAISGALTTPLDVVKTRIMLAVGREAREYSGLVPVIKTIYQTNGVPGFFAGFIPRVIWIFLGGGIFFGVYEHTCVIVDNNLY